MTKKVKTMKRRVPFGSKIDNNVGGFWWGRFPPPEKMIGGKIWGIGSLAPHTHPRTHTPTHQPNNINHKVCLLVERGCVLCVFS
jgi:hypothetical protein